MHEVLFVHGTGVRSQEFEATARTIQSQLAKLGGFHLQGCGWGDSHGAILGGKSIPLYESSKAVEAEIADPLAAWELLLNDPFLEMRLLLSRAGTSGAPFNFGPDSAGPQQRLDDALVALQAGAFALEEPSGLALENSIEEVRRFEPLEQFWSAAGGNTDTPLEAITLLARAVAACWLLRLYEDCFLVPGADERDRIVEQLQAHLGAATAQEKGFAGALLETLLSPVSLLASGSGNLALRTATWGSRRYRKTVADAASLRAGDILLYQARGQEIRDCIKQSVEVIGAPVILLAHSLGGIACVDWLLHEGCPAVRGLVTVGSQAPFLYEIGALWSLPRATPPHRSLPPWLNVYDKNDLLSFLAQPLFPSVRKDLEVKSGQPFPLSHSAYWTRPNLWREFADFASGLAPA